MRKVLVGLCSTVMLLGAFPLGAAVAQQAPLGVHIRLNSSTYLLKPPPSPADPLQVTLTIANTGTGTVYTSAGFSAQAFHLTLQFIDPDGKGIIATQLTDTHSEGPPPRVIVEGGQLVQVDLLETIPACPAAGCVLTVTFNAREFYEFTKAGSYTVKASIPARTYPLAAVEFNSSGQPFARLDAVPTFAGALLSNTEQFVLVADADGDGFAFPVPDSRISSATQADCDDTNAAVHPGAIEIVGNGIDDDCNPDTPDVVVIAPGTISVTAQKHTVGSGTKPGSTKAPIVGLMVRAYEKTASPCFATFGVSWQNYKSIWESNICAVPPPPSVGLSLTNGSGTVTLAVPPGDYLVIGKCGPDCHGDASAGTLYLGVSAGAVASGGSVAKFLQVIVNANGKIVPAKYTTKTGSELLIIEPEYIEWNGTQELYPFIFESIGDWTVTTSVTPPPGFVADYASLTAEVNTVLAALQFTLTNVGSKWVATGVTHKIQHKGKSETVKSEVGVKLSEKLAQAKGLSRFGDAGPPGLVKKTE